MSNKNKFTHEKIETNNFLMIVLIFIVILFAGIVEIIPLYFQKNMLQPVKGLKPYKPLALIGRSIYVREGCYTCHSQMIRPFRAETLRYGHYSLAGEFVYDHPFQWGSKRTGPDLARVGKKYSNNWHQIHLTNPRDVVPESIMPAYPWLNDTPASDGSIQTKMKALKMIGVPYTEEEIQKSPEALINKSEMDALITYLQSLGIHVR
ncbi:MAG: cytochrome-c oxidase, cbb3-type subunit II [Nitrosomonadales bacterium]|jgi:cytochrome c oxidase cbb3-type subunit 2|nr:cytochrome-c oxidase, cbb3-type subunit II [Nitrosomonadales bacterium]MBT3918194.1 cytochrome-c oxidase, cbb3-type subunit II [Nitrosomonadales bacterium]MBT4182860.1 cytochrome-c oxidase, cbb3-type subunit II [Nitrosomonadales bacterium]MBT4571419.1 cytochrome-c oxidase, cbb3-type subunit II [Nitrosomonadales bacterium]MBT4759596.1 cytochrome-c oxidase, cbb3-type subunit II [Nitrosomonadales bacterium]